MPGEERIFVYGTLRTDGGRGGMLEGCEVEGPAVVRGTLYDLGEYPAAVLGGGGGVHGEVRRCPTELLPRLDAYEGVAAGLFRRERTEIGGAPAWVYVAGPALTARLEGAARVAGGRWRGRPAP